MKTIFVLVAWNWDDQKDWIVKAFKNSDTALQFMKDNPVHPDMGQRIEEVDYE